MSVAHRARGCRGGGCSWIAAEKVSAVTNKTMDVVRWACILASTGYLFSQCWQWHCALALLLGFPIYFLTLNFWGFLTLPLYAFTRENREARRSFRTVEQAFKRGDGETALKEMKRFTSQRQG